jgi:tRNA(adenine34) deaminase
MRSISPAFLENSVAVQTISRRAHLTTQGKPKTRSQRMAPKKWSAAVKTVSTYPEHDLFNQDAETVAKHLASKKVSPKGPASGMRMLNFYINRAGKNLSAERHQELERAKAILSDIIRKQKEKSSPPSAKKAAKKSATKAAKKSSKHSAPSKRAA